MNSDDHRRIAASQKAAAKAIAAKVKAGEALTPIERKVASALILHASASIPDDKPQPAGRPRALPDSVAFEAAMLVVHEEMTANAAATALAEKYDVSVPAVKQELGLVKRHDQSAKAAAFNEAVETLRIL